MATPEFADEKRGPEKLSVQAQNWSEERELRLEPVSPEFQVGALFNILYIQ